MCALAGVGAASPAAAATVTSRALRSDATGGHEGRVRDRHLLLEEALARLGVATDLSLGGLGGTERDEVHQRARVDGPVELGVGADRHDEPGELARDAALDEPLVGGVRLVVHRTQLLPRRLGELRVVMPVSAYTEFYW